MSPKPFDQDYVESLAQYGYELIKSGRVWRKKPPIVMDIEGGSLDDPAFSEAIQ